MPGSAGYAYPDDLAEFACERWPGPPPARTLLAKLYTTSYQASLLSEEGRPVTFRAILAEPDVFPEAGGPPQDLRRLEFLHPLRFDPRELRRLSPAADFTRSLIGVAADRAGDLCIWGLVHQGPRWLSDVIGGRGPGPTLPSLPVVHVVAPGSLEARCGADLVARLERGVVSGTRLDVFTARWLPDEFKDLQVKQFRGHALARDRAEAAGQRWASIDAELPRQIGERVVKRALAVVRQQRHGGTIVFVPSAAREELSRPNPYLNIKYRLAETQAGRRFFDVTLQILNRLAQLHGGAGHDAVQWSDFEVAADEELTALDEALFELAADEELTALDEALFELAYLIAGLTRVDGAVVLDKYMQIVGFGAEISGRLPDVAIANRALDLEGESVAEEPAANEGTRHRSAYRLIQAVTGSVAIVISQDGSGRFVACKDGRVTYWEHE